MISSGDAAWGRRYHTDGAATGLEKVGCPSFRREGRDRHMRTYVRTVCTRITADIKEYGMAVVVFIAYALLVNLVFHAFCPVVIFCGFPCPGCGITRAAVCLITGRWQRAWQLNPAVFLLAVTAVYFAICRYLLGKRAVALKWLIAAVFVLLAVIYIVRMYLYFPDRVPYVYTEDNILARILPFYRQILQQAGIL